MAISFKTIEPYLQTRGNRSSRMFSYLGLAIGVLLLLCSIQLFVNLNQLMKERSAKKTGYDFIAISKKINDSNLGQSLSFSNKEIEELKAQSFIEDATPLIANKFIVSATGGSALPFTTDIFLEAIDNSFIDTLPPNFKWNPGDNIVPIIVSSDYLELYNTVFAPSRDLPQVSEQTMSAIMLQLECSGIYGTKTFRGNIVALSDRINSILAPKNFLEWANRNIANMPSDNPTRVYLKTTDANGVEFLNYLQSKNYQVNKDKTRFGRIKQVLQAVVSGLGVFAVLVILLAMMLFSFYLQLMIARSKDNLQLLLTLGYSPNWLTNTVSKKWIPIYIIILLIALAATQLLQYLFTQSFLQGRDDLSPWIHPIVLLVAAALVAICILVNYSLIKKLLNKL